MPLHPSSSPTIITTIPTLLPRIIINFSLPSANTPQNRTSNHCSTSSTPKMADDTTSTTSSLLPSNFLTLLLTNLTTLIPYTLSALLILTYLGLRISLARKQRAAAEAGLIYAPLSTAPERILAFRHGVDVDLGSRPQIQDELLNPSAKTSGGGEEEEQHMVKGAGIGKQTVRGMGVERRKKSPYLGKGRSIGFF